jgi:hypothetical protein
MREIKDYELKNFRLVTVTNDDKTQAEFNQSWARLPDFEGNIESSDHFPRIEIITCKVGKKLELIYYNRFNSPSRYTSRSPVNKISVIPIL